MICIITMAILSSAPQPAVPPELASSERVTATVFQRGESGYDTFRIPSVVALPGGDLLAFAEGRKHGSSDTGDIDLVMKRSADAGATWSGLDVLWDDGANVCGNPCVVLDRDTGVLHLLATWNLGSDHESEIIAGTSEGTRRVWTLTSSDDGANWSAPREITPTAKRESWTWYATGPGIGIQQREGEAKGRLVIPCDHIERGTKAYYSHMLLSDDHGATWRIGGRSTRDQLNECQVAEIGPDHLIVNMRNYDRTQKTRAVMESTDGGRTFGTVRWDAGLPDPICQAGLLAMTEPSRKAGETANQPSVLYFSNCASRTKRERMTLRRSVDRGATWEVLKVLHRGPSAYSCLVPILETAGTSSAVGCLFECGQENPYERIDFHVVDVPRGGEGASGEKGR